MASGISGLIALALRSRGLLRGVSLILQAPVLWGLERRLFPRVMRWRLARSVLAWAFTRRWFQDRFERKQFLHPLDPATRAGFFAGYIRCSDAGWLDAPEDVFLLRGGDLAADPTTWRARAAVRRNRVDEARSLDLPVTSSRDQVEAVLHTARIHRLTPRADLETPAHVFKGIGLGRRVVTGTAVRAATLTFLLARQDLPH